MSKKPSHSLESRVMSYLRRKYHLNRLSERQIERLDAIGFNWEIKSRRTPEEKVALYVSIQEDKKNNKRWVCPETGECFVSKKEIFKRFADEGDSPHALERCIRRNTPWKGMHFVRRSDSPNNRTQLRANLISSIRKDIDLGRISESDLYLLSQYEFPFTVKEKEQVALDERLLSLWDYDANSEIDMSDLKLRKPYKWKCPVCGYQWSRSINDEIRSKGCPACLGRVCIAGRTDLATTNPELASEWNYERNEGLLPTDVVAGSAKRVWWRCATCGGEWQAQVVKRKMGKGVCPYCSGKKLMKGVNDLSSQYPQVALDYLPELNDGVPADEVIVKFGRKIRWKCHVCGHEWVNDVYDRTRAPKPSGCVRCQKEKITKHLRSEKMKETGSFRQADPELARTWDYERNGDLTPDDLLPGTNGKYWFICPDCGRSYLSCLVRKSALCPECARRKFPKGGRKVRCIETAKVYSTVKSAGEDIQRSPTNISRALRTGDTAGGYHWEYVAEDEEMQE